MIFDSEKPTYYEILQLQPYAHPALVVASYRVFSKLYHPDTAREDADLEKFRILQEAYETLSDPVKRREYDMELRVRMPGKFGGGYDGGDFGFKPEQPAQTQTADTYTPPTEEELETYRRIYDYDYAKRRRRTLVTIGLYILLMTAGVAFGVLGFITVFSAPPEQQNEAFLYFGLATLLVVLAQFEAYFT
jgi:hypothetical protein